MLLSSQTRQTQDNRPNPLTPRHQPLPFSADTTRVLARFNSLDKPQSQELLRRILRLSLPEATDLSERILADFSPRHHGLESVLNYHFHQIVHLLPKSQAANLTQAQKILIGAYFTQEETIEAGGLSHPSLLLAPGQQTCFETSAGQSESQRVVLCFQAMGRDLGASLVFREAMLDSQLGLRAEPISGKVSLASLEEFPERPRIEIEPLIQQLPLSNGLRKQLLKELPDPYVYSDLFQLVDQYRLNCPKMSERKALAQLLAAVDDYDDLHFPLGSSLGERVLAPLQDHESRGLEQARFVRFTSEQGLTQYFATYIAHGQQRQQRLLETPDFMHFRSYTLHVPSGGQLALFPRKIRGNYAMLCQVDRFHQCLLFSDRLTDWQNPILLLEPQEAWELSSLGNCGSPIETSQGWLLLTHCTGPIGVCLIGACLLDRDDPAKMLMRLREPLPVPINCRQSGALSSCGSLLFQDQVLIPYSVSQRGSGLMSFPLQDLLARMEPVTP